MKLHKHTCDEGYTKFVVAGDVALFESEWNGYRRSWELPVKRKAKLTAELDPYVRPNDTILS